jgi:hypothetical protein
MFLSSLPEYLGIVAHSDFVESEPFFIEVGKLFKIAHTKSDINMNIF